MGRGLDDPAQLPDQLSRQARWARRLARALLGDESEGEDALQETWLAARERAPEPGGAPEPWLRTSLRHRLLNRARGKRRQQAREQASGPAGASVTPEELLARLEIHKRLLEAVGRLAEPYRQTVLLRYFEELSAAEIGTRLNLPGATVRGRLRTALTLLREDLDRRGGGRRAWLGAMALLLARGEPLGLEPAAAQALAAAGKAATPLLLRPVIFFVAVTAVVVTTVTVVRGPTAGEARGSRAPIEQSTAPRTSPPRFAVPTTTAPPTIAAATSPAPTSVAVATPPPSARLGFSISGRVSFDGPASPAVSLDPSHNALCLRPSGRDEELVVGADGALANVVVRIRHGLKEHYPSPVAPVVVEQRECLYQPRVVVAQAGQPVEFRNGDLIAHTVHGYVGAPTAFTSSIAAGAAPVPWQAPEAGSIVRLGCDLHPWATGSLVVTDNPFFAVTDENGRFAIDGVPPGGYMVEAWHERFGQQSHYVTVSATQTVTPLAFVFGRRALGGPGRCQVALGSGPVAEACRQGGLLRARATMKTLLKTARERGTRFECDDCHADEARGRWSLRAGAQQKFEELVRLQR
jgi:RNA polymerase sigma factor (sigma-70 family)